MKFTLLLLSVLSTLAGSAQFYYKDIIGTRETGDVIRAYGKAKVKQVSLLSYGPDRRRVVGMNVEQHFDPSRNVLRSITSDGAGNQSVLVSYGDSKGNVIRTVDSSDLVISITSYNFDDEGRLQRIEHSSSDSSRSMKKTDVHLWQWKDNRPERMLRIRNGRDTTFVNFRFDDKGNVIEETETYRGVQAYPYQYFYNEAGQLTDVVRYNKRARRLLPEYMFEYEKGRLVQQTTVPVNNPDYLIWVYRYDDRGLKLSEAIYDKNKTLNGRIEYQYSFQQ